jgi:hypothetical protein
MFLLPTEALISICASIYALSCFYMFVCATTYTRVNQWFPFLLLQYMQLLSGMSSIYSKAKICDYRNSSKCDLSLEPGHISSMCLIVCIVLSLVKIFATTQILNVKGCCQWYTTECSDEYSKGYSR